MRIKVDKVFFNGHIDFILCVAKNNTLLKNFSKKLRNFLYNNKMVKSFQSFIIKRKTKNIVSKSMFDTLIWEIYNK